jgi:hypothetical protein
MSGEHKDVDARIEAAPLTSREELTEIVFSEPTGDDLAVSESIPRAEEWVDLAEAGPFVDETTVPAATRSGNGNGSRDIYGGPLIEAAWVVSRLAKLPGIGDFPEPEKGATSVSDTE